MSLLETLILIYIDTYLDQFLFTYSYILFLFLSTFIVNQSIYPYI